jgi:hypothetical protein
VKGCESASHWSIISSAGTNSQLAGVLAGFLAAAITVLFASTRKPDSHTIVLFSSGVLVLGLDSYLFSLITGTDLPDQPDQSLCAKVWSQGMAATGMLAVGGSVLVCGLGWMLVSYGGYLATTDMNTPGQGNPQDLPLLRVYGSVLGACLSGTIVVTTTGMLMSLSIYYLQAINDRHLWLRWAALVYGLLIITVSGIVIIARTLATVRELRKTIASTSTVEFSIGRLPQTTYWTTGLAGAGAVFAGLLSQWTLWSWVHVTGALVLGLVLPGLINLGIASSVAKPSSSASTATPSSRWLPWVP